MNESTNTRSLPTSHQSLIAIMQSATPPPDDGHTPAIPDELLRRLREQYGQASGSVSGLRLLESDLDAVTEGTPARSGSFWSGIRSLARSPQLALAASIIILGVVAGIMLPHDETTEDVMRGAETAPGAVPAYWLAEGNAPPAPKGIGLPKFITIRTSADLPKTGTVLVFDPARLEARMIQDGVPAASAPVTDALSNDEWLDASRQLTKQIEP
jgi:hypothetical protein